MLPPSDLILYCKDEYEAAEKADGIILATEWKQFRFVNFETLFPKLKQRVLFDGRNQYKPQEMHAKGFHYYCIGYSPNKQSLHDAVLSIQNTCSTTEGALAH